MTTSDGYVGATTKLVDHGPDSDRWCLVIVGDGYQATELAQYRSNVESFLDRLRATAPFDEMWCAINVYRIDVVSTESGADEPATCGDGGTGSGAMPRTYFDTTFCSVGPGGVEISRLLAGNSTEAKAVAVARVPEIDQVIMLVNSTRYGGSGGPVATASINAFEIAIHEMGHSAFGLADEYGGSGVGTTPGESPKPNVTRDTNRNTNKWRDLILPTTPMPSACGVTSGANPVPCSNCTPPATPPAPGAVGTYEGGDYSNCDVYRPTPSCYMRDYQPFCPVCARVIRQTLTPFLPAESVAPPSLSLDFDGVPEGIGGVGVTTHRAVVFEVVSCRRLTFRITAGPTGGFTAPLGTVVIADPTTSIVPVNRVPVWIGYTSTTAGAVANGSVTIACDELGLSWTINITARTIPRPRSAVALVLDHSGSMAEDAGDGTIKVEKLREAASIFVEAMLPGDGVGIVRFDDTADRLMDIADVGPLGGTGGRATAVGHIMSNALDPDGSTSIGAGVLTGKDTLDDGQAAASPSYDVLAMVVLSDGVENTAPMLADVATSISANTFAIGLGLPSNISVVALTALTQGHKGYLLVTGELTTDQRTRLTKYFLQVLAGITNASIVVDPSGQLPPGTVHRVPFDVTEADYGLDVFVLTPYPQLLRCALEAPDGTVVDGGVLSAEGTGEVAVRPGFWLHRLALPAVPSRAVGTQEGRWHVLLRVGGRPQKAYYASEYQSARYAHRVVPYDVLVHAYTSLEQRAWLTQADYVPGSRVALHVRILEYTRVLTAGADVWAEVSGPDGATTGVAMPNGASGEFSGEFVASLPGVYRARIRARGTTTDGSPFTRETTLTAVARLGGETPPTDGHDPWCDALRCLLRNPKLVERLGDGATEFLKCLAAGCRGHTPAELERQAASTADAAVATPVTDPPSTLHSQPKR